MKEGIERKACPACGGQIIVSDHWMFSYDQLLGKRGKLLKKRTKSPAGPVECQTAYCLDCKEVWNAVECRRVHDRRRRSICGLQR